ncbi:ubiquitin-like-conjugating enzyme ATG10 isoform X2 [Orcinus orca]|uniref:ubiquitin-like-conjugating enzyme ATG10 isoform X2 n=1 Tax=Orcinus orca TaxID=9733 RepID=UPI00211347B2|nr:ubiquitin-like-conjugating enzyme ATG10 isoform X2 [Orcinus orca]XP_049564269.1 ubiquitin-like-conjugating enzyme ATG10 isoform X2 [Orcinus orca]
MAGNGELQRTVLMATCAKHSFKLKMGLQCHIEEHLPVYKHVFPWRQHFNLSWLSRKEALEPPLDDFEVTETTTATEVIKYEYHVLYSCSYQVPVLYFRASFLDGSPLALKDIWEGVHECYKTRLLHGPWDTITQQEHPILGQPFFVLHPCKTNEFMTPVLKNSQKINRNVNYITSWLSMVGPAVGLNLPLSYARAAFQDEGNVDRQDSSIEPKSLEEL